MTTFIRSAGAALAITVTAAVAPEARQFTSTPPQTAPAERAGWWIRVAPENQASHVFWRFGADPTHLGAPMAWVRGTSPEAIDVPGEQRLLGAVHVAAIGMPPSAPVAFCVFYNETPVAFVQFTQETTLRLDQGQTTDRCVP
jgi:hypothetical protein